MTFQLRTLSLDIGARRSVTRTTVKRVRVKRRGRRVTVRRRVTRTVYYDLLRNPATCAGAWAMRVTLRIGGGDRVRDVRLPCTAR